MKKVITTILLIGIGIIILLNVFQKKGTAPVVVLNGSELIVGESTIEDLGSGGFSIIDDTYMETIAGRTWSSDTYVIGRQKSDLSEQERSQTGISASIFSTGVPYGYAYLYNAGKTEKAAAKCRIYMFQYNAMESLPVLLNGIEISRRTTVDDVKEIMKDFKIESERDYVSSLTLSYEDGKYSYSFEFNKNGRDYAEVDKLYLDSVAVEKYINKNY